MASYRTVTVTATIATNTVTANGEVSEHIFTADADGQQVIVTDPYVAVETVEDGVLLTVRDAHEETQAVIYNGQKGDKGDKGDTGVGIQGPKGDTGETGSRGPAGPQGNPGVDGFSPIATVNKSGDVATISITDKNGTTTATVKDGTDGSSDWNDITGKPTFATVATSGDYDDLANKPTIPDALSAGDGIDIASNVISNTQGIEYIEGTQTAATNEWTGVSTDSALHTGKIIAYHLPYAGTSTAATLNLTMADGTKTGAIALRRQAASTVTTHFAAGNVLVLIYDGEFWKVSGYHYTDNNYVPTGYCTTAAGTAAKSVTCTYGYRDDTTYFPCLFRYANTANNATLAIASYATTAAPIYVNGARTTSSNTFGRGVIMFLYHNGAYYCYNDGRFPILYNGSVTSIQDVLGNIESRLASLGA